MNLLCLCPTFGRPRLVANSIACFLAQDYPVGRRRLMVLDDLGQFSPTSGRRGDWEIHTTSRRFADLPAKYNWMIERAGDWPDAYVVWDDDDVYLPWHLAAHAEALASAEWSHPAEVLSLYTGHLVWERAAGRFHGSLAIGRALAKRLGGWIPTPRADFDQRQISACGILGGEPGRPDRDRPPSYIFRWASTAAPHCQSLMSSPENVDWYQRYQPATTDPVISFQPGFDAETEKLMRQF